MLCTKLAGGFISGKVWMVIKGARIGFLFFLRAVIQMMLRNGELPETYVEKDVD